MEHGTKKNKICSLPFPTYLYRNSLCTLCDDEMQAGHADCRWWSSNINAIMLMYDAHHDTVSIFSLPLYCILLYFGLDNTFSSLHHLIVIVLHNICKKDLPIDLFTFFIEVKSRKSQEKDNSESRNPQILTYNKRILTKLGVVP